MELIRRVGREGKELIFFPHGLGGVGFDISHATPISFPRWKIQLLHEGRRVTNVRVEDERTMILLLQLPRVSHS